MTRLQSNVALLLAAFFWGSGNVAQKTILEDLGPFLAFGLRSMIGMMLILPLVRHEGRTARPIGHDGWWRMGLAALMFCLALGFQQVAYLKTSVTNASFFVNTTVAFTPLYAWARLRERPSRVTWPAIAMVLCGVFLMSGGPSGLNWGDGCCLVSAVLYAIWIVHVAEAVRCDRRPFALAAIQFAAAAVCGIAIGGATEPVSSCALLNAAPELVILGLFSTGAGFTLHAVAQRTTTASDAAIIMSTESLFGAAAAALALDERLTPAAVFGAALILIAVVLIQLPDAPVRALVAHAGRGVGRPTRAQADTIAARPLDPLHVPE